MVEKFVKKPVEVEAIQYTGKNMQQIIDFTAGIARFGHGHLSIYTLEGDMIVEIDDWVIKGVEGEFYPCKPQIFEKTYDKQNYRRD